VVYDKLIDELDLQDYLVDEPLARASTDKHVTRLVILNWILYKRTGFRIANGRFIQ
jgi:hypothetical protein